MRKLISLLICLAFINNIYGQTLTPYRYAKTIDHTYSSPTIHGTLTSVTTVAPVVSKTPTVIRLSFHPEGLEDSTLTDAKIYRMFFPKQTLADYNVMVNNTSYYVDPNFKGKMVDIRFNVNGRITDYTFNEFRKILWP